MYNIEPSYLPDHLKDDKVEPDFEKAFDTLSLREVRIIKYRLDNRFKITDKTKNILQISLIK